MMVRSFVLGTMLLMRGHRRRSRIRAQSDNAPKGVTTRNLVTSLGGFSSTVNMPVFVTGSTVELGRGGQTGREQFRVPTFVYVIEGILTTDYEAGPVGIEGRAVPRGRAVVHGPRAAGGTTT